MAAKGTTSPYDTAPLGSANARRSIEEAELAWEESIALEADTLELQKDAFACDARAVSPDTETGSGARITLFDNSMTWNDDRNRVLSVGDSDSTHRARAIDVGCNSSVGPQCAARHLTQCIPDCELKLGAAEVERDIQKIDFLALNVRA